MNPPPTRAQSFFAPGRPVFYLFSLIAVGLGVAFVGVALTVSIGGTGASIPTGDQVIEATLDETPRVVESPAGTPFLYGEVTLGQPGESSAVDHRWRGPAGDRRVQVTTTDGESLWIIVPEVHEWRGRVTIDERVVQSIAGLPVVSTVDETEAHLTPPYAIGVRALRPGDEILARLDEADRLSVDARLATELHVGTRDELEADLAGREAMRWPVVGLMGIMGLASLGLGYRSLRRASA
ncbi:MAG: hypothetical protein ACI9KE_001207 [Polyangiales bacterium]|jgi:hypothetical protein